jgi:hypothetical protein
MTSSASLAFVQDDDGRWRWRAGPAVGGSLSPLSFATPEEARADALLHSQAPRDASGRLVLPKDYLRRLVSALATACDACTDVYFGGVYWHPRDAGGANWNVAIMSGEGDRAACMAKVQEPCEALRRRFSVIDEA